MEVNAEFPEFNDLERITQRSIIMIECTVSVDVVSTGLEETLFADIYDDSSIYSLYIPRIYL